MRTVSHSSSSSPPQAAAPNQPEPLGFYCPCGSGPDDSAPVTTDISSSSSSWLRDYRPRLPQDPDDDADLAGHPLAAAMPGQPYNPFYSGAPRPACEEDRLLDAEAVAAMLALHVPRQKLHSILQLVCNIFGVGTAVIALFGDRRACVLNCISHLGQQEGEVPWRWGTCGWLLAPETHEVLIVNDMLQDARFADNPSVVHAGVRYYCGSPLVSSRGHRLGSVCIVDLKPRVFDAGSVQLLTNMSELVTRELEGEVLMAQQQLRAQRLAAHETSQRLLQLQQQRNVADSGGDSCTSHDQQGLATAAAVGGRHELQQGFKGSFAGSGAAGAGAAVGGGGRAPPGSSAAQVEAYTYLFRSEATVASAVLLVDTATPQWTILHATTGWDTLQAQLQQEQGPQKQAGSDAAGNTSGSSSSVVGASLWQLLESDGPQQQLLEQVRGHAKSITVPGTKLCSALGGTSVELILSCGGCGKVHGAVDVCLPSSVPSSSQEVAQLVAALSSSSSSSSGSPSSGTPVTAITTPCHSLYFVTVVLRAPTSSSSDIIQLDHAGSSSNSISMPGFGPERCGSSCPSDLADYTYSSSFDSGSSDRLSLLTVAQGGASPGFDLPALYSQQLVYERIAGLALGPLVASGSYGRVLSGTYYGDKVAVKVLDGADVLRRDAATGMSLEAMLSSGLCHPSLVATYAWAAVRGKGQLPGKVQVWGQTLDASKPSLAQNAEAVAAALWQQPQGTAATTATTTSSAAAAAASSSSFGSGSDGSQTRSIDSGPGASAAQTFLIMEFCTRGCLQDAIDRGWLRSRHSAGEWSINLPAVLATAAEIADAMAYLHNHNIVHGDLSAFNVLLTSPSAPGDCSLGDRGFVAKVADFGLAHALSPSQDAMISKTYGTLTHMPPEVLQHGLITKAADVYSFGVLLWQMAAGSRAWAGMSHAAVVHAVCVQRRQLLFPPDTPDALAVLGAACMEHDPCDRPTFEDVLEVLEPCIAELRAAGV